MSQKTLPPSVQVKSATLPSGSHSPPKPSKSPKKKEDSMPKNRRRHSFSKKKDDATHSSGKSPKKEEGGRSRLSSISRMQERLRRRLSRSIKSKEAPEPQRERPSAKYWSSVLRVKALDVVDARLCPLARSSSTRHGPPKTVSGQFQASLLSLVERLEVTNPFFIRCIKSNGEKVHTHLCVKCYDCVINKHYPS